MMKHTIKVFAVVVLSVLYTHTTYAQLSIGVRGAYSMHYSMPDGMRGTTEQLYRDFFTYGDITRYPFAETGTISSRFALDGEYLFSEPFGVYGSLSTTSFYSELPNSDGKQNASMRLFTLSAGVATKVSIIGDLSWLARLGMNTSLIGGQINYALFSGAIQSSSMVHSTRGGIELETGFRYRVAKRLDVEAVVSGSVMNLIGRNSNTSTTSLGDNEFYLNDGEMTRNGMRIAQKDITFLMFQLGVRYTL